MKRSKINHLLRSKNPLEQVLIKGWVRTRRDSKTLSFIEINDGSCLSNIQVVAENTLGNYDEISSLTTGSAVSVSGKLIESPAKGQQWEIRADTVDIVGRAPEDYPLQKKRHTDEFLRQIAHLRPRTNKYGAAFRIRSDLSYAIHRFFKDRDFRYIHTPIITGSDCEGAGELFRVTSLNLDNLPTQDGKTDFSEDFFGREANLTVSGQLSAEMFALAFGDVYTFGPTFRAENSNTRRHAAEFWMVEPEMAFCGLEDTMDLAENLIQELISFVLQNCSEDIGLFAKFVDHSLVNRLESVLSSKFDRIPYVEAIEILTASKASFEYDISYGKDLQAEHEQYLTDIHFKKPVMVFDYPKEIKPFYMRLNDDMKTVAGMDVLLPEIGEIIGGSQREERYDILLERMTSSGLKIDDYWWYLESRKYGSAPHGGFGMGFERMIMWLTGISNIRDVIAFPRTPKNIEF
jgi:asparaginyl-tRNA synthetase